MKLPEMDFVGAGFDHADIYRLFGDSLTTQLDGQKFDDLAAKLEGFRETFKKIDAARDSDPLTRAGRDLSQTAFRTSLSLGNLGGPHTETVRHPTDKTEKGQAKRVPGPTPQLTEPGIPIPDSVATIIILGDATSDRLTTRCAIARAQARWAKPGRAILVAWSPEGQDFDDLLRAA